MPPICGEIGDGCLRLIIVLPTLLRLNRCGTFIKVDVAGSAWSVYTSLSRYQTCSFEILPSYTTYS